MPCGHPCGAVCHSGACPNINICDKKVVLKCRCKKIKKEILCKDKAVVPKPECDANCKNKSTVGFLNRFGKSIFIFNLYTENIYIYIY